MAGLTPLPPTIPHTSHRLTHSQAHAQLSQFLQLAENDAAYRPDSTLSERGPQSTSTGGNPDLTLHHLKRILQGIEGKRIGGASIGADVGRFFGDGAVAAGVARLPMKKRTESKKTTQEDNDGSGANGDGLATTTSPLSTKTNKTTTMTPRKRKLQNITDHDHDAEEEDQDGWQDKADYEHEQREAGMELLDDDRQPGLTLPQPNDEQEAEDMVGVDVDVESKGSSKKKKVVIPSSSSLTGGDKKIKYVDKAARKAAKKAKLTDDKKQREAVRKERKT